MKLWFCLTCQKYTSPNPKATVPTCHRCGTAPGLSGQILTPSVVQVPVEVTVHYPQQIFYPQEILPVRDATQD